MAVTGDVQAQESPPVCQRAFEESNKQSSLIRASLGGLAAALLAAALLCGLPWLAGHRIGLTGLACLLLLLIFRVLFFHDSISCQQGVMCASNRADGTLDYICEETGCPSTASATTSK